jgi:hypothetical protein
MQDAESKRNIRELAHVLAESGHLVADALLADDDPSSRSTWQGLRHQLSTLIQQVKEIAMEEGPVSVTQTQIMRAKIEALKARIHATLRERQERVGTTWGPPSDPTITIRPAMIRDVPQITDLVNIGLMADDAYFKSPILVNRLTFEMMWALMDQDTGPAGHEHRFLVAEEEEQDELELSPGPTLLGCVRVDMPTLVVSAVGELAAAVSKVRHPALDAKRASAATPPQFEAQLGMLAAPPGGRNIGMRLIKAAEAYLEESATTSLESWWLTHHSASHLGALATHKSKLRIIVPVISARTDLIELYLKCGYQRYFNFFSERPNFPTIPEEDLVDTVQLHVFFKDLEVGQPLWANSLAQRRSFPATSSTFSTALIGFLVGSGIIFVRMVRAWRDSSSVSSALFPLLMA